MKLSEYAEEMGISYLTAYRHFKKGLLSGKQLSNGTIFVDYNFGPNCIASSSKKMIEFLMSNIRDENIRKQIINDAYVLEHIDILYSYLSEIYFSKLQHTSSATTSSHPHKDKTNDNIGKIINIPISKMVYEIDLGADFDDEIMSHKKSFAFDNEQISVDSLLRSNESFLNQLNSTTLYEQMSSLIDAKKNKKDNLRMLRFSRDYLSIINSFITNMNALYKLDPNNGKFIELFGKSFMLINKLACVNDSNMYFFNSIYCPPMLAKLPKNMILSIKKTHQFDSWILAHMAGKAFEKSNGLYYSEDLFYKTPTTLEEKLQSKIVTTHIFAFLRRLDKQLVNNSLSKNMNNNEIYMLKCQELVTNNLVSWIKENTNSISKEFINT